MAKIGTFGDIVFEVSTSKTKTFKEFERSGSARWNDHEILGKKPKSEFLGPSLEGISFTILFKVELGINPIKEIEKLRKMRDTGKAASFVIGGKPISANFWTIRELNEAHQLVDQNGNLLAAEVKVDLKEYYIKPKTAKKPTPKKTAAIPSKRNKTLGKITITVKSVNIRSGPSVSNKIIGWAMKGQFFTVYSVKNGWYSLGNGKYITASPKYSKLKKS
ncbi:phage tail protein [Bacillus sp. B-jedd]|uniref:phage tail protein n=1 Tax=Bacillus sp. B-jedd TaxID=1476857 RepID=UPI00051559FE|nr:phage tail protein [Bacillus sp. B-jedd]CEG29791.1 SH3 domain-containing protein [Bacillus sp. B-jedd]